MDTDNIPEYGLRIGAIITVSTIFITTAFIGVLAILADDTTGIVSRVPWYAIVGAGGFAVSIFLLERQDSTGGLIFVTAVVVGLLAGVVVGLSIEGVIFTILYPTRVLISDLVLYLVAAALIGTGVGYWGLRHWREYAGTGEDGTS